LQRISLIAALQGLIIRQVLNKTDSKSLRVLKMKKTITVTYNEVGIPYIPTKSNYTLSFQISPQGDEVEIIGNEEGLLLLSKALLGIAKMAEKDSTYHIHLDELYGLNNENKRFTIRKIPSEQ